MSSKFRETLYYVGTIIPSVLGILLLWKGIDAGAAANIEDVVLGVLNLIGAGAPATAAVKVRAQRKDGTLADAADRVVSGVEAVVEQHIKAQADLDKVKDAFGNVVGTAPVVGPLAQRLIDAVPTKFQ